MYIYIWAPQVALVVKNPPASVGDVGDNRFNPLEEGMATHSRIFAWEIPRTAEPGGLQVCRVTKESSDTTCDKQQQIFLLEVVYKSMEA